MAKRHHASAAGPGRLGGQDLRGAAARCRPSASLTRRGRNILGSISMHAAASNLPPSPECGALDAGILAVLGWVWDATSMKDGALAVRARELLGCAIAGGRPRPRSTDSLPGCRGRGCGNGGRKAAKESSSAGFDISRIVVDVSLTIRHFDDHRMDMRDGSGQGGICPGGPRA